MSTVPQAEPRAATGPGAGKIVLGVIGALVTLGPALRALLAGLLVVAGCAAPLPEMAEDGPGLGTADLPQMRQFAATRAAAPARANADMVRGA